MSDKIRNVASKSLDSDPFELILGIFSFFEKNKKFTLDEMDVHKFFYEKKKLYPDKFNNIFFDDDPDFPYSEEIADALLRLQDANFISRPNPALNEYRMVKHLEKTKGQIPGDLFDFLNEIADEFKEQFAKAS